jgi:hypothetical protein
MILFAARLNGIPANLGGIIETGVEVFDHHDLCHHS